MCVPACGRKLGLHSINCAIGDSGFLMTGSVYVVNTAVFYMLTNARTVSALPNDAAGIVGTIEWEVDAGHVGESGEEIRDSRWSAL